MPFRQGYLIERCGILLYTIPNYSGLESQTAIFVLLRRKIMMPMRILYHYLYMLAGLLIAESAFPFGKELKTFANWVTM